MIAILIVLAIILTLSFTGSSEPKFWHPDWSSCRRLIQRSIEAKIEATQPWIETKIEETQRSIETKREEAQRSIETERGAQRSIETGLEGNLQHLFGKGQAGSHLEENTPEKQGVLSRVKDSLNFTKHLGFVSDLDSPASQAALAEMREKEEREGVTKVVEQAPLSERITESVAGLAQTCTEVTARTAGGVAPMGEGSSEEPESFKEGALPGETSDEKQELSDGPVPKEIEHQQDRSNGPVGQDKEQRKHSKPWAHRPGHKETDAKAEKERHGFSQWALHAARKLGDAVASKDLTDDPSYKR